MRSCRRRSDVSQRHKKTPHLPATVSGAFSWAGFPGAPYP
nr:MAG TPA: hypothetical protein [Caudoviricetes sp.]